MTDEPSTPSSPTPRPRRRRVATPAVQVAPEFGAAEARDEPLGEAVIPPDVPAAGGGPALTPTPPVLATAVDVARGPVGGIRAQDVRVRTGMVGGIAAGRAGVELGLVGGVAARTASFSRAIVRSVVAQDVHLEQSFARVVVANRVQAGPATGIGLVVARRFDGEARILVDWRSALALGAVLGAFAALFRVARRRA